MYEEIVYTVLAGPSSEGKLLHYLGIYTLQTGPSLVVRALVTLYHRETRFCTVPTHSWRYGPTPAPGR
jgi:hypothetical protein